MYPTLYDAIKDLFGLEIGFLQIANTFGFFVAIGFLVANYMMAMELKRKQKEGLIDAFTRKTFKGKPLPKGEYLSNAVMGFIFGYKVIPILFNGDLLSDGAQEYIFSSNGSLLYGILLGALLLYLKYREDLKQRLEEPVEVDETVNPWQQMGSITLVAAITGIIGAKVFHWLEYWESFVAHPVENLLSPSGLTFFGGLICGGAGVLWAAKKNNIGAKVMLDVGGPVMMLAYGIGRMGCHYSGDGDWGIVNTAPKPAWLNAFPDWVWAYNYPNNVAGECDPTGGSMPCDFDVTPYLQLPVFPTPFYEIVMAIGLFAILWLIRKKIMAPGALFGIYMIFAGLERFLIEKIRVNSTYNLFGFHPTQAEIISILLIAGGAVFYFYCVRKQPRYKMNNED
ncbi:MAG: prolipoprotein diacylglyceryl transferase [Flavobacteriales bacterium]|nr:prolipoprotein diacylglyceryl transferase [Flavobacteriales bacterium]